MKQSGEDIKNIYSSTYKTITHTSYSYTDPSLYTYTAAREKMIASHATNRAAPTQENKGCLAPRQQKLRGFFF